MKCDVGVLYQNLSTKPEFSVFPFLWVYDDDVMRVHGRTDVHSDDRTSRSSTSRTDANAARFEELILENRRVTVVWAAEATVGGCVPH
jgi:hypothetical protein